MAQSSAAFSDCADQQANWASAIYEGTVFHRRTAPKAHGFRYGVYSMLFDLDELEDLDRTLPSFSYNGFNLFSFHDRDHGPRDGSCLKAWLREKLESQGIDLVKPIYRVLCFPRVLGYTFDPISVWYCYENGDGAAEPKLSAVIYEVHNTFGDDHSYVVDVRTAAQRPGEVLRHARSKSLHVSPFFDMAGGYRFAQREIGETYHLNIRYLDQDNRPRMVADHRAQRGKLNQANLVSLFWRKPLITLKVVAGIHWEALHLFTRKRAKYHHPPAPGPTGSPTPLDLASR